MDVLIAVRHGLSLQDTLKSLEGVSSDYLGFSHYAKKWYIILKINCKASTLQQAVVFIRLSIDSRIDAYKELDEFDQDLLANYTSVSNALYSLLKAIFEKGYDNRTTQKTS